MGRDWLIASIDNVVLAGQQVRNAMDGVDGLLAEARRQTMAGDTPLEIGLSLIERGAPRFRATAAASFDDFERAVMNLRQAMVRSAVEENGWSVSEVARRMGISRQRASRLYQAAKRA